jgi:hypothetical protein
MKNDFLVMATINWAEGEPFLFDTRPLITTECLLLIPRRDHEHGTILLYTLIADDLPDVAALDGGAFADPGKCRSPCRSLCSGDAE